MEENNKNGKYTGYFSKRLKAGKRRTYFFDVRSTKQGDYFLTITESKKKFDDSYESHKIFLYKEDFKKFVETLNETVDYIKGELMPGYDYDSERPAKGSEEGDNGGEGNERSERPERSERKERNNDRRDRPERKEERRDRKDTTQEKLQFTKSADHVPSEDSTPGNTTPPHIGDDEQMDWN